MWWEVWAVLAVTVIGAAVRFAFPSAMAIEHFDEQNFEDRLKRAHCYRILNHPAAGDMLQQLLQGPVVTRNQRVRIESELKLLQLNSRQNTTNEIANDGNRNNRNAPMPGRKSAPKKSSPAPADAYEDKASSF